MTYIYITHSLTSENTMINQFTLFGNKSQDESTNFCPDILDIIFFKRPARLIWFHLYMRVCT